MMALRMFALAGALACAAAQAQHSGLNDPTRPPASVTAPVIAPGQAGAAGQLAPPVLGPQVQSILVSLHPGGRRVAVINGKMLRQGDRIDGAVLESIQPTHVVLRRGSQRQILKLFRPAARVAAA